MATSLRRFTLLVGAAFLLGGVLVSDSWAGGPVNRRGPVVLPTSQSLINPNYLIAPGLTVRQYAYNISVLGQAYARVPPYALGYNPYLRVYNPYQYSYNPYLYTYNPYAAYSPYGLYGLYGPYGPYGIGY